METNLKLEQAQAQLAKAHQERVRREDLAAQALNRLAAAEEKETRCSARVKKLQEQPS